MEEFREPGVSGRESSRPALNRLLERVLAPTSTVSQILVWQSSRFMRNSTEARIWKQKLKKHGVRVVSITQTTADDEYGEFADGIFELVDELESKVNGKRTRAAMKECALQGFFPSSRAPFGFTVEKVEFAPGTNRNRLIPAPQEAAVVRECFETYVQVGGALRTAETLNGRGRRYRNRRWTKSTVLTVLDQEAAAGTYWWGRTDSRTRTERPKDEWVPIETPAIVSRELFELVQRLRERRRPSASPGRSSSSPMLLAGLVRCGRCGDAYQLETSGKRSASGEYAYRYYNCRTTLRVGKSACPGHRYREATLDTVVLRHLAERLFTKERCHELLRDLVEEAGVLRSRVAEDRSRLKRDLREAERRIARWQDAFESGQLAPDLGGARLRELKERREGLQRSLDKLVPLRIPPPYLYTDANIERFQTNLRQLLLGEDRTLARTYLRLLVESIELDGDQVTIIAKADGALRLMARPSKTKAGETLSVSPASALGWLRQQDSNLIRHLRKTSMKTEPWIASPCSH